MSSVFPGSLKINLRIFLLHKMSLTESEMIRLILYVKYRAWVRIVLAILAYLDWKQGETA